VLAIVGYSLPQTDMWTTALMRACAEERSAQMKHVLIANPDSEAADRLVGAISPAICKHTRVVVFPSFAALIDFLA